MRQNPKHPPRSAGDDRSQNGRLILALQLALPGTLVVAVAFLLFGRRMRRRSRRGRPDSQGTTLLGKRPGSPARVLTKPQRLPVKSSSSWTLALPLKLQPNGRAHTSSCTAHKSDLEWQGRCECPDDAAWSAASPVHALLADIIRKPEGVFLPDCGLHVPWTSSDDRLAGKPTTPFPRLSLDGLSLQSPWPPRHDDSRASAAALDMAPTANDVWVFNVQMPPEGMAPGEPLTIRNGVPAQVSPTDTREEPPVAEEETGSPPPIPPRHPGRRQRRRPPPMPTSQQPPVEPPMPASEVPRPLAPDTADSPGSELEDPATTTAPPDDEPAPASEANGPPPMPTSSEGEPVQHGPSPPPATTPAAQGQSDNHQGVPPPSPPPEPVPDNGGAVDLQWGSGSLQMGPNGTPQGGMLVFGSVPPTPPGPDSGDETPSDSDESLIWPLPTWQPLVELAELLAQDPPLGLGQGGGANGLHFLGNDAGFGVLFPVGPIVAPPNTPETFPDGVSRHSDTSRERSSNFASRTSRRDESTASSSDDEATDSLSTIPEERSSALIDPDAHPEIAALAEPAEPAQQQLSSSAAAAAPVTNPSSNPGQQGEDQTSSSASSSFVVVHPEDGLPAADEPSN